MRGKPHQLDATSESSSPEKPLWHRICRQNINPCLARNGANWLKSKRLRSEFMGGRLCICDPFDGEFHQVGHTSSEFIGFKGGEALPASSENRR
jgi:hypothetical protein